MMNYLIIFCVLLSSHISFANTLEDQFQAADAELNQVYKELRSQLNDKQKDELKKSQLAWIKNKELFAKQNAIELEKISGESRALYKRHYSQGRINSTKDRIDFLRQLLEPIPNEAIELFFVPTWINFKDGSIENYNKKDLTAIYDKINKWEVVKCKPFSKDGNKFKTGVVKETIKINENTNLLQIATDKSFSEDLSFTIPMVFYEDQKRRIASEAQGKLVIARSYKDDPSLYIFDAKSGGLLQKVLTDIAEKDNFNLIGRTPMRICLSENEQLVAFRKISNRGCFTYLYNIKSGELMAVELDDKSNFSNSKIDNLNPYPIFVKNNRGSVSLLLGKQNLEDEIENADASYFLHSELDEIYVSNNIINYDKKTDKLEYLNEVIKSWRKEEAYSVENIQKANAMREHMRESEKVDYTAWAADLNDNYIQPNIDNTLDFYVNWPSLDKYFQINLNQLQLIKIDHTNTPSSTSARKIIWNTSNRLGLKWKGESLAWRRHIFGIREIGYDDFWIHRKDDEIYACYTTIDKLLSIYVMVDGSGLSGTQRRNTLAVRRETDNRWIALPDLDEDILDIKAFGQRQSRATLWKTPPKHIPLILPNDINEVNSIQRNHYYENSSKHLFISAKDFGLLKLSVEATDKSVCYRDISHFEFFALQGKHIIGAPNRNDNRLEIWDMEHQTKVADIFPGIDNGLFVFTPDNYYSGHPNSDLILSFKIANRAHPFEQFDLRLNRPDVVLERLGAPSEAISIAKQLREKRLKRMGVTEDMLQPDFHLPEIEIVGDLSSYTAESELALRIKASDSKYPLDRLRVYVNNVPVNGKEGELLRAAKSQNLERTIPIKLAAGRNKIQVSVLNSAGAESLYANAEVTCTAQRPKPTLYAVAMGVSDYANPDWNLKYAAKDARDILERIKARSASSYGEIKELLLTDRDVTTDSLGKIREFLSKATVDDTVLMFVAGHGLLDSKYDYYFGTSDIDFDNPSGKGIAFEGFDDLLADLPCLRKSLLIDTCHAGELDEDEKKMLASAQANPSQVVAMLPTGARGMTIQPIEGARGKSEWYDRLQGLFVDLRRGSGSTILSSSAGAEYALESSEQKNGLFTYAVLEALDGKEGSDANKDGSVTMSELADYVKTRVAALTNNKQSPNVRRVNLEGDFALSKK